VVTHPQKIMVKTCDNTFVTGPFLNMLVSTVLIHHHIGGQAWRFVFMSNAICTVQRLLNSV